MGPVSGPRWGGAAGIGCVPTSPLLHPSHFPPSSRQQGLTCGQREPPGAAHGAEGRGLLAQISQKLLWASQPSVLGSGL